MLNMILMMCKGVIHTIIYILHQILIIRKEIYRSHSSIISVAKRLDIIWPEINRLTVQRFNHCKVEKTIYQI